MPSVTVRPLASDAIEDRPTTPLDERAVFYDAHPYPPPVESLEQTLIGWDDQSRRRAEHFLHWPTLPYQEERSILIAGCGTSQAARWAARHPAARVVGIDVSLASLEATKSLADRHGVTNLELRELPIENSGDLGEVFDQVVCTGVLHHLADPQAGLQALRAGLAPDGALQLMVYASHGRTGISMMREYCRRLGIGAEDVSALMEVLKEIPLGHPMSHVLREAPDFEDRDAIADALLNPREQTYTVPELFDLLDQGGMRFARWVRQAPYRPQCGIMGRLSQGGQVAALAEVDQYAAMELFRGTITRHSLIAHRDDASLRPLDWQEDWTSFVPMIPATVIVVEDRLPPGKAAAVINQAHVDRDLVCFLDADQLSLFRAVDGDTSLGDITGAGTGFFEHLWLHDLVVVDASAS
ncbi:MAG TPA: class I SAM-dependent methyltransferase [Acidimicrobiia bacterium]